MATFPAEIERRAGGEVGERTRTTHAALCLLAPWLSEHGRRAAALRGADATALQPGEEAATSVADLVDRVAARAQVPRCRAAEVAGVVAAVLGEGEDPRRFLAADCPAELVDLFVVHQGAYEIPRAPPHPGAAMLLDVRRTLSSANPWPRHALAQAHPTAQRGSVADAAPHGERKLSSGASSLERGHRTLATGAPKGEPVH
ncbi:MAG: hypothetical protein IT383_19365 [Deltaproteobacteria bacterium]|nr:hypothetical protein [Deltaproteobacteria bacterium]